MRMSATNEVLDAVTRGDAALLETLLAADPARAAERGPAGQSLLLTAIYHGRRELLPLLRAHAQPDLHEAAALGDVVAVRALLAAGAATDGRSADGWTPLHLAAFFADRETVDALLAAGADVHAVSANPTANQPLHAAFAGRTDRAVVERLIEAGADVGARAGAGWTPLHLAASRGAGELVEWLLARGAERDAAADDGRTAAAIAEERGHATVAARLRA